MKKTLMFSSVFIFLALTALPSLAAKTCEKYGLIKNVDGGKATVQNNVWGADTRQCVTNFGGNGFQIVESAHNRPTNGNPASYPSIFRGCHWNECTSSKQTPVKVSDIKNATFSINYSFINSGAWNATAEAWFKKNSSLGQPDGTELMLWFNSRGGVNPAGSKVGTITTAGATWDVYYASIGWHFLTYKRRGASANNGNINLMPFINDAISRGKLSSSWYMMDMEAGYELWKGGAGLTAGGFSFNVTKK